MQKQSHECLLPKVWVGIEKINYQLRSPINSAGNCKLPASSIQRNVPEQRWQRDVLQQNEEVDHWQVHRWGWGWRGPMRWWWQINKPKHPCRKHSTRTSTLETCQVELQKLQWQQRHEVAEIGTSKNQSFVNQTQNWLVLDKGWQTYNFQNRKQRLELLEEEGAAVADVGKTCPRDFCDTGDQGPMLYNIFRPQATTFHNKLECLSFLT